MHMHFATASDIYTGPICPADAVLHAVVLVNTSRASSSDLEHMPARQYTADRSRNRERVERSGVLQRRMVRAPV